VFQQVVGGQQVRDAGDQVLLQLEQLSRAAQENLEHTNTHDNTLEDI